MPCYDHRNEPEYIRDEERRRYETRLGKLTRLLREANLIIDRTFAEPDNVRSVELRDWWRRYRRDEQEQER